MRMSNTLRVLSIPIALVSLIGCSGGHESLTVKADASDTSAATTPPSETSTSEGPPTSVPEPVKQDIQPTINRNIPSSATGTLCWVVGEITLSQITGTYGAIGEDLKLRPADPGAGLERLDAVLETAPSKLDEVSPDLPPSARAFFDEMQGDILRARDERSRQGELSDAVALDAIFRDTFDLENYKGVAEFKNVASNDKNCSL